ncbi:MAG: lamin tail domain-containing protein [Bacteroidota bacterium]
MKNLYVFACLLFASSHLMFGQLIINEICYDPSNSGLDGDTNGDGAYAQAEDEFLELYNNTGSPLDVSGYTIFDAENLAIGTPNHTVPVNTMIPAGGVLVVFGGGTPTGSFGGAVVQTSTFGDLNMNNAGDTVYIFDANMMGVDTFDIEPLSNNPNESYTRNPDITGDFEQHGDNFAVLFSPGTMVDGNPFATTVAVASITVAGSSGATSIDTMGGTLQMIATVMPTNASDSTVSWSVTPGSGDASIDSTGLLTAIADGSVTVTATANDSSGISGSTEISISNQTAMGIDEIIANQRISLYPNPSSDAVLILAQEPIQAVQVYTMEGKLLTGLSFEQDRLEIQSLQAGLYLLRIRTADSWKTKRLVKE